MTEKAAKKEAELPQPEDAWSRNQVRRFIGQITDRASKLEANEAQLISAVNKLGHVAVNMEKQLNILEQRLEILEKKCL